MNSKYIQTGLFCVSLVGVTQPALSADLEFVDKDGEVVTCGSVDKLTVTSTLVTAKGTESCLTVAPPPPPPITTPTAAAHNLGTVNTDSQVSKILTDQAIVELPLPSTSVTIVSQPTLPGATATANGATAVYSSPSADQITASAGDSFTYKITDASGNSSDPARVDVQVNWVEVPSGGCTSVNGIVCMGPVPDTWPTFHPKVTQYVEKGETHAWSFVYASNVTGQIGAVLATGTKDLKISEFPGDTAGASDEASWDCARDFGEYVYYEPAASSDQYKCNLIEGRQYYFNIRNTTSSLIQYQLKGSGVE